MWDIGFITEEELTKHVEETIRKYGDKLSVFDVKKFNSNLIDPIKLIFDKTVYNFSWEEIIKNEIFRQRDKSNNNDIGNNKIELSNSSQNNPQAKSKDGVTSTTLICPKCKSVLPKNAKFCGKCGIKLSFPTTGSEKRTV